MYSYYGLQSNTMSLRNILIPSGEDDQINVMIFLSLSPCSIFFFPFPKLLFSLLPFSPSTTLFFFSSQILRSIVYSHNVSPTIKTISQTSPFYLIFLNLVKNCFFTFSPFVKHNSWASSKVSHTRVEPSAYDKADRNTSSLSTKSIHNRYRPSKDLICSKNN